MSSETKPTSTAIDNAVNLTFMESLSKWKDDKLKALKDLVHNYWKTVAYYLVSGICSAYVIYTAPIVSSIGIGLYVYRWKFEGIINFLTDKERIEPEFLNFIGTIGLIVYQTIPLIPFSSILSLTPFLSGLGTIKRLDIICNDFIDSFYQDTSNGNKTVTDETPPPEQPLPKEQTSQETLPQQKATS